MGNFLDSVKLADLVESVDGRRETTMETEDLAFNNSSERKIIEELSESLPDIGITVFPEAFIVEAVPIINRLDLLCQTYT